MLLLSPADNGGEFKKIVNTDQVKQIIKYMEDYTDRWKEPDCYLYTNDYYRFAIHKEVFCQTELMRNILKSAKGHCCSNTEIFLPDCSKDIIRHVVSFLYTGQVPLDDLDRTKFDEALDILGYPTSRMIYKYPSGPCHFCKEIVPSHRASAHFQDHVNLLMTDPEMQDKIAMNQLVSCVLCQNNINYIGATEGKQKAIQDHYDTHYNEMVYRPPPEASEEDVVTNAAEATPEEPMEEVVNNDDEAENNNFDLNSSGILIEGRAISNETFERPGDGSDSDDPGGVEAKYSLSDLSSDEDEDKTQNNEAAESSDNHSMTVEAEAEPLNFENPVPVAGPSHQNGPGVDTLSPLKINPNTVKKKKRKSEAWTTNSSETPKKKKRKAIRIKKVACNLCFTWLNEATFQHFSSHVTLPDGREPVELPEKTKHNKSKFKCYLECELKATTHDAVKTHIVQNHCLKECLREVSERYQKGFSSFEDVFRQLNEEEVKQAKKMAEEEAEEKRRKLELQSQANTFEDISSPDEGS